MIRAIITQRPTTEETIQVEITGEDRAAIQADLDAFMAQVDRLRTEFNEKVFLVHQAKMDEIETRKETEGEKLRGLLREIESRKAELAQLEQRKARRLQTA